MTKTLTGDGSWPFTAVIDGDDIVVTDVVATCFGGAYDPQDDGRTSSGISTKPPGTMGVSLAVISISCGRVYKPTAGSPLAFINRIPWGTRVDVTINGHTVKGLPLIDNGPGKQASKPGAPHAIDLTAAAAAQFNPNIPPQRLASQFEERCSFRIIGAAKYAS